MKPTDIALMGCALIVGGLLVTSMRGTETEAYGMSAQARCEAAIVAAAVIELAGGDCMPESGHPSSIVELCKVSKGRTAAQVANLPQCKVDEPHVPHNQGS